MWPMLLLLVLRLSSGTTSTVSEIKLSNISNEQLLAKLESMDMRLVGLEERLIRLTELLVPTSPTSTSTQVKQDLTNASDNIVSTKTVEPSFPSSTPTEGLQHHDGNKAAPIQQPDDLQHIPKSCRGISPQVTGIYRIQPTNAIPPMDVRCDMEEDGGGWILVQNRIFRNESFDRNWREYEASFGDLYGDFWLGLEKLSAIVNNGLQWEIIFWMTENNSTTFLIKLGKFKVGNVTDNYTLLQLAEPYDDFILDSYIVGRMFSTFDRDNDQEPCNCALEFKGGWWHDSSCCEGAPFMNGPLKTDDENGPGKWTDVESTRIMIREKISTN